MPDKLDERVLPAALRAAGLATVLARPAGVQMDHLGTRTPDAWTCLLARPELDPELRPEPTAGPSRPPASLCVRLDENRMTPLVTKEAEGPTRWRERKAVTHPGSCGGDGASRDSLRLWAAARPPSPGLRPCRDCFLPLASTRCP